MSRREELLNRGIEHRDSVVRTGDDSFGTKLWNFWNLWNQWNRLECGDAFDILPRQRPPQIFRMLLVHGVQQEFPLAEGSEHLIQLPAIEAGARCGCGAFEAIEDPSLVPFRLQAP